MKLKFSQLGASRGRGGRRRISKKNPSFSLGLWSRNIYILGAGDLGGRGGLTMVLRSAWFRSSQGMEGIQREVKKLDQQSLLFLEG